MVEQAIRKGLATIGLALACGMWMYVTSTREMELSGIGWFILGLLIIWA